MSIEKGSVFKSLRFGEFEVIDKDEDDHYTVRFISTGYITKAKHNNVVSGSIKDKLSPTVYGIGCIGDGPYVSGTSKNKTLSYQTWFDMIRRCYDPKNRVYARYGGRGVTVCDEWLNYQTFAEWFVKNYRQGFKLDKDLTNIGSMQYSEENCEFIPVEVNNLLISSNACRGQWPVGVSCQYKKSGFSAECWDGNKKKHNLGYFKSPESAFEAYRQFKTGVIRSVAQKNYEDGNISEAIYKNLMNWKVVPYPE